MTKTCPIDDRARAPRGFTVVELCFGLIVTALVMGAVAAFLLATAQSWRHSDQTQTSALQARQASMRLVRAVQESRLIGAVSPGDIFSAPATPAAVILWVTDANGDGAIQGAECAMIEHDPATKVLRLYPAGQGDTTTVLPWATFTSQAILTNFRVGRHSTAMTRGVEAVRLAAHGTTGTTQNPTLEYTLKLIATGSNAGHIDAADRTTLEYGTCAVRAPARQPA